MDAAEPIPGAPPSGRLLRYAAMALGGAVLVVGLIGLMHTPSGLQLYSRVVGGGCPVGRASAADVERGRLEVAHAARGRTPARARPAMGFTLDRTTAGEVDAWIDRYRVSCQDRREGTLKLCTNVPAEAVGRRGGVIDELALAFSPTSHALVNVAATRHRMSVAAGIAETQSLRDGMRSSVGEATRSAGALEAERLQATPYATAVSYYEFSDYLADITLSNIPGDGFSLREHYMSAR